MRFRHVGLIASLCVVGVAATCDSTDPPAPTSIAITQGLALTFASLNTTQQLDARVLDQSGNTMAGETIAFLSNGTGIATVSATGLVTAVGNGSTTITVSSTSLSATVNITVTQVVSSLTKGGDAQTGPSSTALGQPLTVTVRDANGVAMAGAAVTFAVTAGGGSLGTANATANASGVASTTWTLGAAGNQGVSATSGTVTATFTAAIVALQVTTFVGGNDSALVGYGANTRPAVRVTQTGGTPVANVTVTFAVASGGGSVTGASVQTSANGIAQVGRWTVAAGVNTLTATVATAGGSPVTFTTTGIPAAYNITIQNIGPAFSPQVQAAFDSALAFWQRAIYGDLPDITGFSTTAGQCGSANPIGPVDVDDVLIVARIDTIDGPGLVLGSAGPCFVRTTGRLTIAGSMRFDSADVTGLVNNGSLNAVIRHEMGHVLGFGTLWTQAAFLCLQNPGTGGAAPATQPDTYFSCARAVSAFDSIGGTNYTGGNKVPVENCGTASPAGCGTGTINGHWREPTFFNEMMTGYLNGGVANPGSLLTIAAMGDLAYVVNYGAAEAYTRTFTAGAALRASPGPVVDLRNDIDSGPIYLMDRNGRVVGVFQRP